MPKAKRVSKKNIGERFYIRLGENGMSVVLLELEGTGNDAVATFSDSHFPDGRWGKWKAYRYNSRWTAEKSGKPVTIVE